LAVKLDNLTGYAEEDRPMKRKSRTTRRSNMQAADIYDAFPRSGLVRHYAPFIRKYVREFCKGYPQLSYEDMHPRATQNSVLSRGR
jgi:DNA-directed RNA polymerase specialized sigma subunit